MIEAPPVMNRQEMLDCAMSALTIMIEQRGGAVIFANDDLCAVSSRLSFSTDEEGNLAVTIMPVVRH